MAARNVRCKKCYEFEPHIHEERLTQPLHWKKPRMIAANFMGDWLAEEFRNTYPKNAEQFRFRFSVKDADRALARASQFHKILTLTKNYSRFASRVRAALNLDGFWRRNSWFGVTICSEENALDFAKTVKQNKLSYPEGAQIWISMEPFLDNGIKKESLEAIGRVDQIIVGCQTRPTVLPHPSAMLAIAKFAHDHEIPIFIKDNLWKYAQNYLPSLENFRQLIWAKENDK
jgi:protein gp37